MVVRVVDARHIYARDPYVEVVLEVTRMVQDKPVTEMLDPFRVDVSATMNEDRFLAAVERYVKHKYRPDSPERFIGLEFTV